MKNKLNLTSDLITINDDENSILKVKDKTKTKKTKTITVTIEESLRSEVKAWCAIHNKTISETFVEAFNVLRSTKN